MKKILISLSVVFASVAFASTASAANFWKVGKIKRVLTDDTHYSGCMVLMDSAIGNNCPSVWVSLDCKGLFNAKDKEIGKNKFAAALAAAQAGKTVGLYVNDANKVNGYCVARRIDVHY